MSVDRIPPNNLEAEEAVLGTLISEPREIASIAQIVKPAEFYSPAHVLIAEAIYALDSESKPIHRISLAEELRRRGTYEKAGSISYLSRLESIGLDASGNAKYYATLVAEKAKLRSLIAAGKAIYQLGFEGEEDVDEAINAAETLLRSVSSGTISSDGQTAHQAALEIYHEIDAAMSGQQRLGIPTPFRLLDKHTGRFHRGEVVVVAGAPGMGKSVFAVQCAEHAALYVAPSAIFALEMGVSDTVRRIIASRAQVNVRNMRRGEVTPHEMEKIGNALGQFAQLPMWFYDARKPKGVADIRRICRGLKDKHGLSLVVVDHPGFLADVMTRGRMSKHETLELCYQQLKSLADELGITLMIVQHINRQGMDREPSLGDLRDGGNLEGIAHIVIFPYRSDLIEHPSLGELIVAKNRDGEPGKIPMSFDGARFQWRDQAVYSGAA